ncbi:MAG: 2Fe-2S iron-sulfur cluster-binding protein [Pirellulales bacterium]
MELTSQTIGTAVGWLGIGWVGAQGLLLAVRTLQQRLRARRKLEGQRAEFRRRVEAAARAARAEKAAPDWEGWRPFRVAAIVDEARDVKSFYFAPADGRPLARFAPGQYLTFRLPIAGSDAPLVRCYSLSDRPREDFYRCTIKRIGPPLGRPTVVPGRGSSYFHDVVKVGDVLSVRAPAGTFFVDPLDAEPIVLVGAGIGITPLVSMLDAIIHAGRKREVYALFGFRNGRDHPFKERLARLAGENPQIQLHVSYSAPRVDDVLYRDYSHLGRMTIDRVRAILPSNNFRFFVCGPGAMMESLVPALWDWGVPESHVLFEAFGPASVKRVAAGRAAGAAADSCSVRFERSGRALMWDGSLGSLLEFGEAAGVVLPSGCRAGSCGECLVAIRSGKVAQLKRPGITVPPGQCLTCLSIPIGELVLDA